MSRQWPFLIPFVSMAAGLTVSAFTSYSCSIHVLVAGSACLLLSLLHRNQLLISFCTALFFFFWGLYALTPWLSPVTSAHSIRNKASNSQVIVEGLVASRPTVAPDGSRLIVSTERVLSDSRDEPVQGLLMLYVTKGDISLEKGDRIRFKAGISIPHRLGLPGEFDYPRYLAFQGITAVGRVVSQEDIIVIRAAAEESFQRSIDIAARRMGNSIRTALPDERISSVLTALLLGDQKRIPQKLAEAYTRAGVNHILSISGFHVGIIAAFISLITLWILTRFESLSLLWNVRRASILMAVPSMWCYLFLTGNAPATARSVIMLVACAVALYVERETDAINSLLLAACLLLVINPASLFDISFQLSFISLWGIIVTVPSITERLTVNIHPRSLIFIQFLAASIAASCTTIIPVLYTFKVASLNGIMSNFLIVPLMGYGAVILGFCVLPLIVLIPSASSILLWPAAKLVYASNMIVEWFSALPVIHFSNITSRDMFFFLFFMFCVTFLQRSRKRLTFLAVIPFAALTIHLIDSPKADGRLHITMLSVGQAESLLIRLPSGSNMLVDGGGYLQDNGRDFGQRILVPALETLGINKIDRMILTHNHPDHIGGLSYAAKNLAVGEFWTSSNDYLNSHYSDLGTVLTERKVPVRLLAAGDSINLSNEVTLDVLSPEKRVTPGDDYEIHDANEESMVFRICYGEFSMLFTADSGFSAERRIISNGSYLKSTVLKVGHHGSGYSTSEEFVNKVRPKMALISAGAGNRFGLPSEKTIHLLDSKGIVVYRTDRDGTIELVTDGNTINVATRYRPD